LFEHVKIPDRFDRSVNGAVAIWTEIAVTVSSARPD